MVIGNGWHRHVIAPLRKGSIGHPLPGFSADIVAGQIAIDVAHSPLFWFTGYQDDDHSTADRFTPDKRWYLTADTGRVDEDGYFRRVGGLQG